MNYLFNIGTALTLLASPVFAGPNVSGGPQASENLVSRLKIASVLNAITGVNDVVESVQLENASQYIVTIRNGQACNESLYTVKIAKTQPLKFTAKYTDLISSGPCN